MRFDFGKEVYQKISISLTGKEVPSDKIDDQVKGFLKILRGTGK